MTTGEAVNYFNNFNELSAQKKLEKADNKKVNNTKNAVSESVKGIDIKNYGSSIYKAY